MYTGSRKHRWAITSFSNPNGWDWKWNLRNEGIIIKAASLIIIYPSASFSIIYGFLTSKSKDNILDEGEKQGIIYAS